MKKPLPFILTFFGLLSYGQTIDIELFASGFSMPTDMVHAGDSRMFLVEQGGTIRILNADGSVNATPFLNISSKLSNGGERGLLGLAFHPDYANNGYFFVNYTNLAGNTVVARYSVNSNNADVADAASEMILFTVTQPFSNHNGGCLRFGPDGYLYVSMGDGGNGGDPNGNAQNINVLLGKMLRLDVDNGSPYGIPDTNPFANTAGADEIWAYGLRNAWKFSFNRLNGDMWIADVGQGAVEEIDRVDPANGGYNFGWRCFEGSQVYNSSGCSVGDTYTVPVAEYTHAGTGGCSITGGYAYTGNMYPALQGRYIFADYCSNEIGMLDSNNNITWSDAFEGNFFTTFGEDINGELYIAGTVSGNVYRIVDSELATQKFDNAAFTLYPNPAEDVVAVRALNNTGLTGISVYDMSGKILLNKEFTAETEYAIPVSALPSGLYLVRVAANNGSVSSGKLSVK